MNTITIKPMKSTDVPNTDRDFVLEHRRNAFCRVRLFPRHETTVVVVSELADNRGVSVTNAIEEIATRACAARRIDPERTIWVEHLPTRMVGDEAKEETFDLVTFSWNRGQASKPDWNAIGRTGAEALIGKSLD